MSEGSIIDLSYPVGPEMLVFPGAERPVFSWRGRTNAEGYNLTRMSMIVHTGTHNDSPLHFIEEGVPIDRIPLHAFYGKTRLFRMNTEPEGQEIGIHDLMSREDEIEEGSIFLLETGIGKYAESREYNTRYPVPSDALVELLIRRKIRCYMTDATSIDPWDSRDNPRHKAILGAGIPLVENLANLGRLPEGHPFLISALPMKLQGREGAPCRAVAIL